MANSICFKFVTDALISHKKFSNCDILVFVGYMKLEIYCQVLVRCKSLVMMNIIYFMTRSEQYMYILISDVTSIEP